MQEDHLVQQRSVAQSARNGPAQHHRWAGQLAKQREDPDVKAEYQRAIAAFEQQERDKKAAQAEAEVNAGLAAMERNAVERGNADVDYDAQFEEIDLAAVEAAEQEAAAPEEAAAVQTEHAAAERAVSPPSTPPAGAVAAPVASETPRKRRRAPAPTTGVKKPKPNPNTTTGARKRKTTTRK